MTLYVLKSYIYDNLYSTWLSHQSVTLFFTVHNICTVTISPTLVNECVKGIALSSTVFLFDAFRSFSQKAFLEYALQWGLVPVFQESHYERKTKLYNFRLKSIIMIIMYIVHFAVANSLCNCH